MPLGVINGNGLNGARSVPLISVPPVRGPFNNAPYSTVDAEEEEVNNLRTRVEDSGAIPLGEADITILMDSNGPGQGPVAGKERVYFVSAGELEKLVVNVLLVVYVP